MDFIEDVREAHRVLGLEVFASKDQISSAYRSLALRNHPDVGGTNEAFREAQAAYELLSDRDVRWRFEFAEREARQSEYLGAAEVNDVHSERGASFGSPRTGDPVRGVGPRISSWPLALAAVVVLLGGGPLLTVLPLNLGVEWHWVGGLLPALVASAILGVWRRLRKRRFDAPPSRTTHRPTVEN